MVSCLSHLQTKHSKWFTILHDLTNMVTKLIKFVYIVANLPNKTKYWKWFPIYHSFRPKLIIKNGSYSYKSSQQNQKLKMVPIWTHLPMPIQTLKMIHILKHLPMHKPNIENCAYSNTASQPNQILKMILILKHLPMHKPNIENSSHATTDC
jgi:hypothetical protein